MEFKHTLVRHAVNPDGSVVEIYRIWTTITTLGLEQVNEWFCQNTRNAGIAYHYNINSGDTEHIYYGEVVEHELVELLLKS